MAHVSLTASPAPLCGFRGGSGQTHFVYLHGGPGYRSADFVRNVAPLLARDAEVVAFDQRGAGCSPKATGPDAYSLRAQVDDAVAVIRDAGAPVVLVGHSYGGLLATHVALEHPELIAGLALVGAPLDLDHSLGILIDRCAAEAPPEKAAALLASRSRSALERIAALDRYAPDCTPRLLIPPGHHPDFAEIEAADRAAGFVTSGGAEMNTASWKQWPTPLALPPQPLAHVPFPVLAIWGDADPYYPDPAQRGLPVQIIAGSGHMVEDEQPQKLAEALLAFARSPAVQARLSLR